MSSLLFWLLMLYLAGSTVIALRRGPKVPARLAIGLALVMAAFPWVRSWLSTEGRGDFHPAGLIANLEWLLVLMALGPVHAVCLYVIITTRVDGPVETAMSSPPANGQASQT